MIELNEKTRSSLRVSPTTRRRLKHLKKRMNLKNVDNVIVTLMDDRKNDKARIKTLEKRLTVLNS